MRAVRIKVVLLLLIALFICPLGESKLKVKKVYLSYILHGNMNYDRYVCSTIWNNFPIIYNNLLDFMDEHPDFKGQVQFSGQTFNSLQKASPNVIAHALRIHKRGQLNFTGTFYSEPVNVNMDGETNYRCAMLGTSIIKDVIGSTDGFYLQERAYHPQLPWIFKQSGVSWAPIITGKNDYFPFKLKGLDGSISVCVPISNNGIVNGIKDAPNNGLVLIENDYEIPDIFTFVYNKAREIDNSMSDVEVEWITVKDYIKKFGVKEEQYVDHTAKAASMIDGTYSKWTADPLDIIIQNYTNHAMNDFRSAMIINSLMQYVYNVKFDRPFSQTDLTLKHDPLVWNIERADLYPTVEPTYLSHDGEVTILSKAEHLLLWAVNSDAKGWFPLYEKRRERINSFENSSSLSKEIIYQSMDWLGRQIKVSGYDRYYMLFNNEQLRKKNVTIEAESPYTVYDCATGKSLKSQCIKVDGKCMISFETSLPSYGYKVIGLKRGDRANEEIWQPGEEISSGGVTLKSDSNKVVLEANGQSTDILLDSFKIKALAEMENHEKGDSTWRDAKAYGTVRISVRKAIYPQLRIEKQIDWLVHMQQIFTIIDDKVLCDIHFVFPHPTLIKKGSPTPKSDGFDPRGLTLMFRMHRSGELYYDIPFGISKYDKSGIGYFCSLSTCFFQYGNKGGMMFSQQTGEQAFYADLDHGEVGFYLGASTISGPIRNPSLKFVSKTEVDHESAWYFEPFHGEYEHQLLLLPYQDDWKNLHLPLISRNYTQPVYIRECYPEKTDVQLPSEMSYISIDKPNVEITSMEMKNGNLQLRLNDKEGKVTQVSLRLENKIQNIYVPPFGIITKMINK